MFNIRFPKKGEEKRGEEDTKTISGTPSKVDELAQIKKDLDILKAQVETGRELSKEEQERSSYLTEQLGELRNMVVNNEKQIKELESETSKAISLIEAAQLEKVIVEIKKQEAKVEAIKNKMESNEMINSRIIEELKNVRNKIGAFSGIEEVIKIAENIKKDISNIQKINSTVERHSSKVEKIFANINKKTNEFEQVQNDARRLEYSFKEVLKDFDELKIRTENHAEKKDLASLDSKINKKLIELDKIKQKLIDLTVEINKNIKETEVKKAEFEDLHNNLNEKLIDVTKGYVRSDELNQLYNIYKKEIENIARWIRYFHRKLGGEELKK